VFQEDFIPQPKFLFSKRFYVIAAVAGVLSITLTSCGLALNEGNGNPDGNMKLNDGGAGCIEASIPKIERYFKGTATEQETFDSWACVNTALKMFYDNVRGQDPNFYTPEELRTFLQSYFLGKIKLSDRFMDEAFRLKQIFLGGERRRLSREEVIRLMSTIRVLQQETVRLLPHLQVILQKADPNTPSASPEKIYAAKIALNQMTDVIGQIFAHAEAVYAEEHAHALLLEVQDVFNQSGSIWQGPTTAIKHLPTFFVFKSFLLHPTIAAVFPDEWGKLCSLISRLYGTYLHTKYLVLPSESYLHGKGLEYVNKLADEIFGTLQNAVNNKSTKVISFDLIDKVIEQVYFLGFIDKDFMQDHTMKSLVRNVVGKVYHPAVKGIRPIAYGIDTNVLNLMRADFYGFTDMQSTFDGINGEVLASSGKDITYAQLREKWPTPLRSTGYHSKQIHQLLNQRRPQMWDDEFKVIYDDSGYQQPVTPRKFTEINWRRMLIYLLSRGYSADAPTVEANGLVPDPEFRQMFMDFKEMAAELQFLDPKDTDFWKSTSEESRIFFLSSDGKANVTIAEGYDFLGLALTAGKMTQSFQTQFKAECKETGYFDSFKEPLRDKECFRRLFRNNYQTYFAHLPGWVKSIKALTVKEFDKFLSNLELVTLEYPNNPEKGVQVGDLVLIGSSFQYDESIFWRYDKNKDGFVDYPESLDAYPVFKDFIAEAGNMTDEDDILALYTYLLRYKRAPTTIFQKAEFLWWKMNKGSWKYSIDRVDVMEIIAAMSKVSAEGESQESPETPPTEEEQSANFYSALDNKFFN
jgi:hypothetical protein